mgnify:CR=1 FL=1
MNINVVKNPDELPINVLKARNYCKQLKDFSVDVEIIVSVDSSCPTIDRESVKRFISEGGKVVTYYPDTLNNIKIYIDLDGVMADFEGYFLSKGITMDEFNWKQHIIVPTSLGKKTFIDFPLIKGALEFYKKIEHLNPTFYSATGFTGYEEIRAQKQAWVKAYFPNAELVFSERGKDKAVLRATPNSILIDDSIENINEWNKYGTGIYMKYSATESEFAFELLYKELMTAYSEIKEKESIDFLNLNK